MMSARAFQRVSVFLQTGRPSVAACWASSSSSSGSGKEKAPKGDSTKAASKKAGEKKAPPPPVEEPFDNSQYRAKEQFEYGIYSFYDMEVDMAPSRCPQQSSKKSLKPVHILL